MTYSCILDATCAAGIIDCQIAAHLLLIDGGDGMRVSELEREDLDYWVEKAEGRDVEPGWEWKVPAYSLDWLKGGPIIEREEMNIGPDVRTIDGKATNVWFAQQYNGEGEQIGSTPLIAAMRCYVASKFGAEVPNQE
jgi:hypothetical protein